MNEYDVSVIIPIYNCEKYLKDCVKSILNQDYKKLERIQVILIDDGSTDKSLKICNELKRDIKEFTIEIITGENEGVSSARNKGIQASKGRYIMFIDADDFISKNAIRKLVEFFDENYDEIDVVSYPRYVYKTNVKDESKKKKILDRYKKYTKTGIYDLAEDYEKIEPTLNIMVKNMFEDNILFDTNLFFHEDTLYITQIVLKKLKIGFVKDVRYLYRIYGDSTTDYKENPLYSFEQYMYVYEKLFEYTDEDGFVPKYIQILFLNVVRYRILKDMLFPYHLQGEEWDKAHARIINLIKKVNNETIMEYSQMNIFHRIYLIRLKNEQMKAKKVFNNRENALVDSNGDILSVEKKIIIVVNRFEVRNKKIQFLGYLKSILFMAAEPEVWLRYKNTYNEEIIDKLVVDKNTVNNKYKTDIDVAQFYNFSFELDIENLKEFELFVVINGKRQLITYYFNKWAPFNNNIGVCQIYRENHRIQYKDCKFYVCMPKSKIRRNNDINNLKIFIKINKNIAIYRAMARFYKNKFKNNKIWIYNDRANVYDNAYSQFKHDIKINDNIKKYYVVDAKKEDYVNRFTKEELKYVVQFRSMKHKLLFLNCDKLLTSFSSLQDFSPFYNTYQYYKDILHYELVYLQHGLLHAHYLKMYSKGTSRIDKIIISSYFEQENLTKNYAYSEKDIIPVGMPRFYDKHENNINLENKIIFAPSWREYLIGDTINRKRELYIPRFENSKYYKEIIEFLSDEKLLKLLKENNLIIDFKIHPVFEPYQKCFKKIENENVIVSIGSTDLNKYKAFITDFSSFQFDFVKIKRPMIYFVPDMDEFRAGLHTYRELDLKHEDAFGKLCLTGNELVKELIRIINNDFNIDEKYKKRMENFFFDIENGKEKLYNILKIDCGM